MQVVHLRVNQLSEPLGYEFGEQPSFAWLVTGSKGQKQTAARLRVARDPGLTELLYDSGWSTEPDSLGTRVPLTLEPRSRYWWQVGVRTDAGEEALSEIAWFETGKMLEGWEGSWIAPSWHEGRHPVFTRTVEVEKPLQQARLYISAVGLYEAELDGRRIGDEFMTPYSTNYHAWLQTITHDLTSQLAGGTGRHELTVVVGDGWYKGRFGFTSPDARHNYGDRWGLVAELRLLYTDGSEAVIASDGDWQVHAGVITDSSIYNGEMRDDTLAPGPRGPAEVVERPVSVLAGTPAPAEPNVYPPLSDRLSPPVRLRERFSPILIHTPAGETVLDLGQNIAGTFELAVDLPAGSEVHLQFGEILQYGNFYRDNLRTAKAAYHYTASGEPTLLRPRFTFYGYRFVKVEGIPDLDPADFTGIALYSEIPDAGWIETGHPLINQLVSNTRWGMRGNFLDVPTDCPQRDERMGWTGDAQVFAPTAIMLADTYAFYRKYLRDMWTEQQSHDGMVPNVIPSFGMGFCSTAWGDAACIMPWEMYRHSGDTAILEEQYDSMVAWAEYVTRVDGDDCGWQKQFHFGDWLSLDRPALFGMEPLGETDVSYISYVHYYRCLDILARTAAVVGRTDEVAGWRERADRVLARIREQFFTATGRLAVNTQTALLLALAHDITPDPEATREQLAERFRRDRGMLLTGFVGTPIANAVLADNGLERLAWRILLNEDYPGWLNEIKLGATTIWERWNSVGPDGLITDTGMNSLNHYAYGSIVHWIVTHAGGLRPCDQAPGFRRFTVTPLLHAKLGSYQLTYRSPLGVIRVGWQLDLERNMVELDVTVPFGATADLALPLAPAAAAVEVTGDAMLDDTGRATVATGSYRFVYQATEPLEVVEEEPKRRFP